jgi:uncharacterized protein
MRTISLSQLGQLKDRVAKSMDIIPPPSFHVMTKPRGAICNLDCDYCYFLSKEMLYKGSRFRMALDLLEEYTRQYIAAQRVSQVTFTWQGGEPTLMGLPFFKKALELQQKYRRPGMLIQNSIQTNGTLLNAEWAAFFKEKEFLVGLSLDGPRELHDTYRHDKGGHGTFDKVMKAVDLLKTHGVEFNILTTINAANVEHPLEVYRFLRDEVGTDFVQFIPIVERQNKTGFQEGTQVTERSITGEEYGRFMIAVFDEWVRQDVGKVFVQLFDTALNSWLGLPSGLCVFDETCGTGLAMEHNGDIYSCDHFVEPKHKLGNLRKLPMLEMIGSEQQRQFGLAKRETLPRYCRECPVRFACNGGCPKDRILTTPDGEVGLNYLCAGYRAFFTHIDRPMKLMAREIRLRRSPANIMARLVTEEAVKESELEAEVTRPRDLIAKK